MKLISEVFNQEEMIPTRYTCDGQDISPPLKWKDVPEETISLALICDDPDAPAGTWVHWVIFNIPSTLEGLKEKVPTKKELKDSTLQGKNDFDKIGYGGPCPPDEKHRYFFKLYALDSMLNLNSGATKKELVEAMQDHIIAKAELVGNYSR